VVLLLISGARKFYPLRTPNVILTIAFSRTNQGAVMPDHVYKIIELTGTSATSIEDAVNCALSRASKTLRDLRWFELTETRGEIKNGKVGHWQVTLKVGFTLDEK
jgi:flavin-binding protein dodecin